MRFPFLFEQLQILCKKLKLPTFYRCHFLDKVIQSSLGRDAAFVVASKIYAQLLLKNKKTE
ncbi:MAG TPA: hypothetical protein DCR35_04545 [Runella sp.]|nr:hypothetical protein [Runella sp.]HAO48619.1 hypothetical protein [Runella sp.]